MQQNITDTESGEKSGNSTPQKSSSIKESSPSKWKQTEHPVKRKRGRPRKYPLPDGGKKLTKVDKKSSPKKVGITKKVKQKKRKNSLQTSTAINIHSKWGLELTGDEFLRACQFGQTSTVRVMIRKGVNVNSIDKLSKNTGLHEAIALGHMEIVKLLLKHPETDIEAKNIHNQTPTDMLKMIKDEKDFEILSGLIKEEVEFRRCLATNQDLQDFFQYLSEGNLRKAKNFMEVNAMVEYGGFYSVHVAAKYNQPELLRKFNEDFPEKVPLRSEDRATSLHVACRWSSTEAAQCLLLELGADPLCKDIFGRIPSEYVSAQCKELRKVFRKYAREHSITDPRIMIETCQRYILDGEAEERGDQNPGKTNLISQSKRISSLQVGRKKSSKKKVADLKESEESASPKKMIALSREERKLQQVLGILERVDTSPKPHRISKDTKITSPTAITDVPKLKRGPGRPRKYPRPEEDIEIPAKRKMNHYQNDAFVDREDPIYEPLQNSQASAGRKKRGRPRKEDKVNRKSGKKGSNTVLQNIKKVPSSIIGSVDPLLTIDKGTQRTLLHKAAGRETLIKSENCWK